MVAQPKKVLILMGPIVFGGIEVWVYDLLRSINRNRFEPIICSIVYKGFTPSAVLYERYLSTNVKIYEVRGRGVYDPRLIFDIGKIIKQTKADIIHANYVTWGVIAGLMYGVPTISHLHHTYSAIHRPVFNNILHKFVKHYITTNQTNKTEIASLTGVSADNIKVIYCGIDVDKFQPVGSDAALSLKQSLHLAEAERVVITVCRLHPRKGLTYFLQMAQQVKAKYQEVVKFLIVGDGPLLGELIDLAETLGIKDDVVFTGEVDVIQPFLAISDIFVMSSFHEGAPITLLEAFAMQKPVVSTAVGRAPELVQDNVTGFLIPIADTDAMADKVLYLLEHPDVATACGRRAGKLAPAFDNQVEINKLEDYYNEILRQNDTIQPDS